MEHRTQCMRTQAKTAALISFTAAGDSLARRAASYLESSGWTCTQTQAHGPSWTQRLGSWAQETFHQVSAIIVIGSTGIAVRMVAPMVSSKTSDPAVLVLDEAARWVMPLLSGHLGGANALARQLADALGAQAAITTASDVRGVWSPDGWAQAHGVHVLNPGQIKRVSAGLLAGKTQRLCCDFALDGELPPGLEALMWPAHCDVHIGWRTLSAHGCGADCLQLVLPCIHLGMGCRRGIALETVQEALGLALTRAGVELCAIKALHTIDLKANEPALRKLCQTHGWPLLVHPASELRQVKGSEAHSAYVQQITGVDNVCERAALMQGGHLVLNKFVHKGVTVALAAENTVLRLQ